MKRVLLIISLFSDRLRKYFLDKGAAPAIFEGLRRFIGFPEVKFENSLQYSCQVLVALLMSELAPL